MVHIFGLGFCPLPKGGRLPVVSTDPKVQMAKRMHGDHGMSIAKICETLKISRATFYRYVALPGK